MEPEPFHKSGLDLLVPQGTSLKVENNSLVVVMTESSMLRMPRDVFDATIKRSLSFQKCAASIGPGRSFLALYDDEGGRFWLNCVDTDTGTILWKADVWACGAENLPIQFGGPSHNVALVIGKQEIGVFGICSGAQYLEVFNVKTGVNVCRFATNYWYSSD